MDSEAVRQVREALEYAALRWSRYRDHGDQLDLKAATGTYRRILASEQVVASLRQESQAARANLAMALVDAFALTGEIRYLDESVTLSAAALELETTDAGRLTLLNTRYVAFLKRFIAVRNRADLAAARDTVDAMERLAPTDSTTLMNRGNVLMQQFDTAGSLQSLDEAIGVFTRCAELAADHRGEAFAALADALVERYRLRSRREDIEQAFGVLREALRALPADSPRRRDALLVLGNVLLARFDASDDPALLDDAIDAYDSAIPSGTTPSSEALQNVGYARILRYRRAGDERDLDLGIIACEQAIGGAGGDLRLSPGRAANLALGLAERWRLRRATGDLDTARLLFRGLSGDAALAPKTALEAGFNWGALEREAGNWDNAHVAYQHALAAAESLLESSVGRDSQETWLYESRGLGERAAYAAARCGDLQNAVLSIERSRAVLWTHALRLGAADVASLAAADPALADRFREAAVRCTRSQAEMAADAWRELQMVLADIRRRPGFERWLQRAQAEDVWKAALDGDRLVYLAAADEGGMALVVGAADGAPRIDVCWLPDLTHKAVRERLRGPDGGSSLGGYLGAYAAWRSAGDEEAERAADVWSATLDDLLGWLWTAAVAPVLDRLPPTGRAAVVAAGPVGFLPLHAAWCPDDTRPTGRVYALDRADFVYTSNAMALVAAEQALRGLTGDDLLAIENPRTAPEFDLPTAAFEVRSAARWFERALTLRGEGADSSSVTRAMADAAFVHLCCHAEADTSDPLASAVQLADGAQLTLREMLGLRLARCRLVLLSACETAVAGTRLPDEVVSLQGALLQAGAVAAIATSWAVYDTSSTLVMARFYEEWRGRPGRRMRDALRGAQQWVRDSTNAEKRAWLTSVPELVPLAGDLLDELDAMIVQSGADARSFALPPHWAGFTYAGV